MFVTTPVDDEPMIVFLDEDAIDELIDALCNHRGLASPLTTTDYDRRLAAMKAAKPLVNGLFSVATPQNLVIVANYLLNGLPDVGVSE